MTSAMPPTTRHARHSKLPAPLDHRSDPGWGERETAGAGESRGEGLAISFEIIGDLPAPGLFHGFFELRT